MLERDGCLTAHIGYAARHARSMPQIHIANRSLDINATIEEGAGERANSGVPTEPAAGTTCFNGAQDFQETPQGGRRKRVQ